MVRGSAATPLEPLSTNAQTIALEPNEQGEGIACATFQCHAISGGTSNLKATLLCHQCQQQSIAREHLLCCFSIVVINIRATSELGTRTTFNKQGEWIAGTTLQCHAASGGALTQKPPSSAVSVISSPPLSACFAGSHSLLLTSEQSASWVAEPLSTNAQTILLEPNKQGERIACTIFQCHAASGGTLT